MRENGPCLEPYECHSSMPLQQDSLLSLKRCFLTFSRKSHIMQLSQAGRIQSLLLADEVGG